MREPAPFPVVDEPLLREVVRRILQSGSPETIVLFGSRARGDARLDSDLDLLIIERSDLPRYRRSTRYYLALADVFPSKDILVYTPQEIQEWSQVPNAMPTAALREGKVLYARAG